MRRSLWDISVDLFRGARTSATWKADQLKIVGVTNATIGSSDNETAIESTNGDPQCQVKLLGGVKFSSLRPGPYSFIAVLTGDIVDPVIYIDIGGGFSELPQSRLPLFAAGPNRYKTFFQIPAGGRLQRIRFDPSTVPGKYIVTSLNLSRGDANASGSDHDAKQALTIPGFDEAYYLQAYPDVGEAGIDPAEHFLFTGHLENRNPSATFRTGYYRSKYLESNSDENPLLHYNRIGRALGNYTRPPDQDGGIANEVALNTRRSQLFEPLDPSIIRFHPPNVRLFAFYLSQFHRTAENDTWWGTGFTEWTNVARGLPRYRGHYQPRIPADLGFYDLNDARVMVRQADLAKSMGLSGFIYYYYWFNRKRLLQHPVDTALQNPDFNFPFALMWANENWTRTWDGGVSDVLIAQDYKREDDEPLVADLARYMRDRRYITLDQRPLLMIYRPAIIPEAKKRIGEWRRLFRKNHGIEPLIFMAQFDSDDPRKYDLDGAVEFPPHKIGRNLPLLDRGVVVFDDAFDKRVFSYTDAVNTALTEPDPEFDLIKSVFPMWDNDARRQRFSTSYAGSTPQEYERWLKGAIAYARRRPVRSQSIVCVNAWNEWAEGAYLEPDVHFGGAYLNATARALTFVSTEKRGVLLIGHDAHDHGAQRLLLNIAKHMRRKFGINLEIAVLGPGKLVSAYNEIARTTVCVDDSSFRNLVARKRGEGTDLAICNSTPGGRHIEILKDNNVRTISLIHELPTLLHNYKLNDTAAAIASQADVCVFPSDLVREKFEMFAGIRCRETAIRPQGLFDEISADENVRRDVRKELGIPDDARIIVNAAFGDLRKGFDLFRQAAQCFAAIDPKAYFLWVGTIERELNSWLVEHHPTSQAGNFLAIGFRNDLGRILLASDVFLLSSREDPFPTVLIDALAAGLPIVAMQKGGGFVELFTHDFVGQLAKFNDVNSLCDLVRHYLELPSDRKVEQAKLRRQLIERDFDFDKYVFALLRLGRFVDKSVSVIVPNYNYARYLKQRLSGIFNQTYPIFEIIVLDDASSDDSLAMLDQIEAEFDRAIVRVVNTNNSGSVFSQWRRGVERARGDLIWIAEADDDARPNFLAQLVRFFSDEPKTIFAFSDSSAIDENGKKLSDDYRFYYSSIGEGVMAETFLMDAKKFAVEHLSVRNHILNVSSVLWSRKHLEAVLIQAGSAAAQFRLAGDWRLYVEACSLDGQIAFTPEPANIHRRHTGSVTGSTSLLDQVEEIKRIHDFVLDRFPAAKRAEKSMAAYRQELAARARPEPLTAIDTAKSRRN